MIGARDCPGDSFHVVLCCTMLHGFITLIVTWDAIRSTQFCLIISTTLVHNNTTEIEWVGMEHGGLEYPVDKVLPILFSLLKF